MTIRPKNIVWLCLTALSFAPASSATTIGPLAGSGFSIPDDIPPGASSTIVNPTGGTITDVTVEIDFGSSFTASSGHTWMGDLEVSLSFSGGGSADLFNCVDGDSGTGCPLGDDSNLLGLYSFNDAGGDFDAAAASVGDNVVVANGAYFPATTANTFDSLVTAFGGRDAAGDWELTIFDNILGDTGGIVGWSLTLETDRCSEIPEPGAVSLLVLGLAGLVAARRLQLAAWR